MPGAAVAKKPLNLLIGQELGVRLLEMGQLRHIPVHDIGVGRIQSEEILMVTFGRIERL